MIEKTTKRTIWIITCACGYQREWIENPPKEFQCRCKNWLKPMEISWDGPDFKEKK